MAGRSGRLEAAAGERSGAAGPPAGAAGPRAGAAGREGSGAARRERPTAAQRRERRAAVEDPEVVMESAASFLAARPRSVAEVRRRLRHHGYREELVEIVLSRLTELGYLDEEAFAQAWVVSRDRARPRGERALRRELIQKGIDRETIAAVLADRTASAAETGKDPTVGGTPARETEADSPDEQAARRLLERRRSSLLRETDPLKRRQKAYALLARNGFDPEICRAVASSFAAAQADEPAGP